jgi:hypothetical protein
MDQPWHSVFYNSMSLPWHYFCYLFDALVVNSLTRLITYVGCQSIFVDDFKVYSYSVFAGDLWISRDIVFLTIPWVCHDSIFAIDLMRRLWIYRRCQFHTSAVSQYSLTISRSTMILFLPSICGSAVTVFLTIPCISHDSSFAIYLMRGMWIQWRCRFHTTIISLYSLTISRSTVTLFSLMIYGSEVT